MTIPSESATALLDAPVAPARASALCVSAPRLLTVQNRMHLMHTLLDALDDGARHLVVDLSATTYVDSSGLSLFAELNRVVRELGGRMWVSGVSAELRTLFDATRLSAVLDLLP